MKKQDLQQIKSIIEESLVDQEKRLEKKFATKGDVREIVRDELTGYVTKNDLKGLATKDDLKKLRKDIKKDIGATEVALVEMLADRPRRDEFEELKEEVNKLKNN